MSYPSVPLIAKLKPGGKVFLHIVFYALLTACGTSFAKGVDIILAGRHTVYWAPQGVDEATHPLLLFSHGYGGCATQSSFLMEALANDGFWVFAPDHDDARCGRVAKHGGNFSLKEFRTPGNWNDTTHADRRNNLVDLLNALKQDPRFSNRIDFSRLGLLGHSLGGYTVLGAAGAWSNWRMEGIKAVLALSPYSQPFNLHHTLTDIRVPVMFQGGTLDFGITPAVSKGAGSYEQANAPKYYVEFEGAGHFAWTDLNKKFAESIAAYSVAFLGRYVKGSQDSDALTRARKDVSRLDYDSELGRWEGRLQFIDTGEAKTNALRERIRDRLRHRIPPTAIN